MLLVFVFTCLQYQRVCFTLKIEKDQEVFKIESESSKKYADMETKLKDDLREAKEKTSSEFYDKMSKAVEELHSKGNHNTEFLKEMTLKMLEVKGPKQIEPSHVDQEA